MKTTSWAAKAYFSILLLAALLAIKTKPFAQMDGECKSVYCVCDHSYHDCSQTPEECASLCGGEGGEEEGGSYSMSQSTYDAWYKIGSAFWSWVFSGMKGNAEQLHEQEAAQAQERERQMLAYQKHQTELKALWKSQTEQALRQQEHYQQLEQTPSGENDVSGLKGGGAGDLYGLKNCHEEKAAFGSKQIVCEGDASSVPNPDSGFLLKNVGVSPAGGPRRLTSEWEKLNCSSHLSALAKEAPNGSTAVFYSDQAAQAMAEGKVVADCGPIPPFPSIHREPMRLVELDFDKFMKSLTTRVGKSSKEIGKVDAEIERLRQKKSEERAKAEDQAKKVEEIKAWPHTEPGPEEPPNETTAKPDKASAMAEALAALKAAQQAEKETDDSIQKDNEAKKRILKDLDHDKDMLDKVRQNPGLAAKYNKNP